MVQDFSIAAGLLLGGWALFIRRDTWHCKLGRALTISIALIVAGMILTSPMITIFDSGIGIQHFDDYLGHVCFLASLCTIVYALLARTLPDRTAKRLMRWRVEYPTAAVALLMLILVTLSPSLHSGAARRDDFFEVSCGPYLHAYWTIYVATVIYLMGYMLRLLRALCRDPRSRQTANLYLVACVLGIIAAIAEFTDTWIHFIDGSLWLLLTAPAVLISITAALSWRRQRQETADSAATEDTPPSTPKITT